MTTLTIASIGNPADTQVTTHDSHDAALAALVDCFGTDVYHRDHFTGTIRHRNGRVFQASKTWRIDPPRP